MDNDRIIVVGSLTKYIEGFKNQFVILNTCEVINLVSVQLKLEYFLENVFSKFS